MVKKPLLVWAQKDSPLLAIVLSRTGLTLVPRVDLRT
jgi:hypothetical protein